MTLKFELGIMDEHPLPDYSLIECREHREIAEKIARKTPVLLKNDGILPLDTGKIRKIAVIGPTAADIDVLRGNYAGTVTRYITLLDGLVDKFGEDNIIYARGCEIVLQKSEPCAQRGDRFAEAAVAAELADVVILSLGLTPKFEGENGDAGNAEAAGDKLTLEYSAVQKKLLDLVIKSGKPVVLVNFSGSAVNIPADGLFLAILNKANNDFSNENCSEIIKRYIDNHKENIDFEYLKEDLADFIDI